MTSTEKRKIGMIPLLYLFLLTVLPAVYSEKLLDPVLISRQWVLTLFNTLLFVLLGYRLIKGKLDIGGRTFKSPVYGAAVLGIVLYYLSISQAGVASEAWNMVARLSMIFVYFSFTLYFISTGELKKEDLLKGMAGFAMVTILIAIFQLTQWESKLDFRDNIYNIKSTSANKNLLSSILYLCGGAVLLLLSLAGTRKKALLNIILILTLGILILIQTRMVLLSIAVSTLAFFVLSLFFRGMNKSKKSILIGLTAIVLTLLVLAFLSSSYWNNLTDTRSFTERAAVWNNSLEILQDHLWLGVGANNWQFHFPAYGLDGFTNPSIQNYIHTFQRPHNDLLWIACETGIIGGLNYLFLFIAGGIICLKTAKTATERTDKRFYLLLGILIPGYLLISLGDFPLERVEHQMILWSLLAIAIGSFKTEKASSSTAVEDRQNRSSSAGEIQHNPLSFAGSGKNFVGKWMISLIMISFLAAIILSYVDCYYRSEGEKRTHLVYRAQVTSNWKLLAMAARNAENPLFQVDQKSIPLSYYAGIGLLSQGFVNEAKAELERALVFSPANIHILNNLGVALQQLEESDKADEYFSRALSVSPNFEEAHLNIFVVEYNKKNRKKAFEEMKKINYRSQNPNYLKFMSVILRDSVSSILTRTDDPETRLHLTGLFDNPEKLMDLYRKSFETKKDFAILASEISQ